MTILLIIVHVIACITLIGLVLIQRGRGGGLVESFAGVESMFGTKTSAFLTRTTTIMSVVFFITCLGLAALSVKQSKSLMRDVKSAAAATAPAAQAAKTESQPTAAEQKSAPVQASPAETAKPDAAQAQ